MNRAENRAEQYRALAEDVCNRASREPNPIVKAEWENLATNVRAAWQGRRTTLETRDRPTTRSRICWSARETDVTLQRNNAAADYLPVPRSRRSITGVNFGSSQDHHARDPHPGHETDDSAQ